MKRPVRRCNSKKCNQRITNEITITSCKDKKVSPPKPGGLMFSSTDLDMISKTFKATKLHRVVFFYDTYKQRIIFLTDTGVYDGKTRDKLDILMDRECYIKMESD